MPEISTFPSWFLQWSTPFIRNSIIRSSNLCEISLATYFYFYYTIIWKGTSDYTGSLVFLYIISSSNTSIITINIVCVCLNAASMLSVHHMHAVRMDSEEGFGFPGTGFRWLGATM